MYRIVPELAKLLNPYLKGEVPLQEMRDKLYLQMQILFGESSQDDKEMLSELLACIYEVEDGVMAEEKFRQAVTQFIRSHSGFAQRPVAYRKRVYRISDRKPYRISIKTSYRNLVKRPYSLSVRQHSYNPRTTSKTKYSVVHFHPRLKRYSGRKMRREPRTMGTRLQH